MTAGHEKGVPLAYRIGIPKPAYQPGLEEHLRWVRGAEWTSSVRDPLRHKARLTESQNSAWNARI
jgi:hypothetical protein